MLGALIGATVAVAAELRIWIEKRKRKNEDGPEKAGLRPQAVVPIRPGTPPDIPGAWVRGMAIGAVVVFGLALLTAVTAMVAHGSARVTTSLRLTTEIVGMLCVWGTAFGMIVAVNERNRGVAEVGGFAVVTSLIAVFGMVIIG